MNDSNVLEPRDFQSSWNGEAADGQYRSKDTDTAPKALRLLDAEARRKLRLPGLPSEWPRAWVPSQTKRPSDRVRHGRGAIGA